MEITDDYFEQIPKIAILNANGDVERTLLCDKYKRPIPPEFSNSNNNNNNNNNTNTNSKIEYVDLMIYPDDPIHTIKLKILRELGIRELSYSEIYLFGIVDMRIDLKSVFDSVLERATDITIPAEIFGQLLITLGVDKERMDDIPQKKDYSYEDLLFTGLHMKTTSIAIPIGKQFLKPDYLFSANPYYVMEESQQQYRHIENNPLISFENHILLNYGTLKSNTIYVCLADSVFEYARTNRLREDAFPELYFPMLFKKNIYGSDSLQEKKRGLIKDTNAMNTKMENMECEAIDLLYDIFQERKEEMPYIENGITDFTCIMHPDREIALPLEVIFKNIHSSKTVPFIKYNPGPRREKIYRLYSEEITKTGSRIPFLDKNIIMVLSKTMAKTHEISFYLPLDTVEYGAKIEIFINIYANGDIRIILKTGMPLPIGILENLIKVNTNYIIGQINNFLFQSSFQLREFDGILNNTIEVLDIKYKMSLNITKNINVKEQWNLLQFLFDSPTNESLEDGIHMRYIRVENYVKMNDESSHIAELFKQTENEREIIRSLIDKFQITEEQAILRIARFFDEFTKIEGHFINKNIDIVDNPGFPVEFRIVERIDNKLEIKIDNIINIQYIECIFRHIDSILRITQNPTSTGVKAARIRKLQAKKMKSPEKKKENKKDGFENVITTKKMSQPLNFQNMKKTTEEDYDIFFQNAIEQDEDEDDEEKVEEGQIEDLSLDIREPNVEVVEKEEGNDFIGQTQKESQIEDDDLDDDIFLQNAIEDSDDEDGSRSSRSTSSLGTSRSSQSTNIKGGVSQNTQNPQNPKKGGVSPEDEANIEPYVLEQYKTKLDGMPLKTKNSNHFLNRLTTREPTLFLSNPTGKFKSYSRMCPSNIHRQPVILTQTEKDRIDREYPGSYKHSISYGTNPANKFHYICPRYWCLLTKRPMTEEEVQESIRKERANPGSSACGLVLPRGETKVRKGHYIYQFDEEGKQHRDKDGKYVENVPNFLDTDAHPDGKCIPCCFKKQWDSKGQIERREQCNQEKQLDMDINIPHPGSQIVPKKDKYILGIEKVVLTQNRWGFLPISAQGFLQTDYTDVIDPNNPAFIKEDATPPLLRFGIEQNSSQSFVGVLADLYKIEKKLEKVPSIREMSTRIIPDAITLDAFIQYHNGSLVGTFRKPVLEEADEDIYKKPKYESSNFIKSIDMSEESQVDFLIYTVAAFEKFIQFLRNPASVIDHIFLWDIVSTPNRALFPGGINLAILEIEDADITDNIHLICPTNAYSTILYDPRKPTAVIIKRNEFYEPIYEYQENPIFREFFTEDTAPLSLKEVFRIIRTTTRKYCSPLQSIPPIKNIYEYKKNHSATVVAQTLGKYNYQIDKQVLNYQGKVIGFYLTKPAAIFIPTYPSSMSPEQPALFMDNIEIWKSYMTTRDTLTEINRRTKGGILCRPMVKVDEDGLIVGILTETNQFIQVNPPEAATEDGIPIIQGMNYIIADKVLTTSKKGDVERELVVRRIQLEEQFYLAFRTTIQILLKDYENRAVLKEIMAIIYPDDDAYGASNTIKQWMYKTRLGHIERILRGLARNHVEFVLANKDMDFLAFENVMICRPQGQGGDNTKKYCIARNGQQRILIPKKHLYANPEGDFVDNERLYFRRMADELLRYKRIQFFVLDSNINIPNTDYKLDLTEMLILNSQLSSEYFTQLVPYKQQMNITYDTGNPYQTQKYANRIPHKEQMKLAAITEVVPKNDIEELQCIKKTGFIPGNASNIWRQRFPTNTQEYLYHNSAACTFAVVLDIIEKMDQPGGQIKQTERTLKELLLEAYRPLFENESKQQKVLALWGKQGKKAIVIKIRKNMITLDEAILNEDYYLTNLDIWIIADRLDLPIIIFNIRLADLNYEDWSVNWLVLGKSKDIRLKYFFIRPPIRYIPDTIPEYGVVTSPLLLSQVKGLENMVKSGLAADTSEYAKRGPSDNTSEYARNIQAFDSYMTKYSTVIVAPKQPAEL